MRTVNKVKADVKLKELTQTNKNTQMVLQTVEMCFDTQARKLQVKVEIIKVDLTIDHTMVFI
jgi:hypothetical protein